VIEGRVQGVGFRFSTARKAQSLGLTGWVKNLPDGRVEALFEGESGTLDTMDVWCQEGPRMAAVRAVSKERRQAEREYSEFRILG